MFDKKTYMKEYNKQWRLDNPGYGKQWRKDNKEHIEEYSKEYKEKHNKERKEYSKKYYQEHKDYIKEYTREWRSKNGARVEMWWKKKKIELLNIVSDNKPYCVGCGCDDTRLLEINHKNGGGCKETNKGRTSSRFRNDILSGNRKTDDLEILCRVCNSRHYLELKYGELPYKIYYNKGEYKNVN